MKWKCPECKEECEVIEVKDESISKTTVRYVCWKCNNLYGEVE